MVGIGAAGEARRQIDGHHREQPVADGLRRQLPECGPRFSGGSRRSDSLIEFQLFRRQLILPKH